MSFFPGARQGGRLEDFGELLEPSEAAEPILAKPVRNSLLEWLTEIWATEELEAVGLQARHRAIFSGPPGVGKTTLAHHLSARLGLPMLAVRPERLINCWLGSTAQMIGALFDVAGKTDQPLVLFMDEFDAIAMSRGQAHTGAEHERNSFVNTLLQRLEQHDGFLIAATNRPESIDPAIWRRFHIQITLELPGQSERERILARYLSPYGLPPLALTRVAESMELASPALMREFSESLKRQLVIGPKVGWDMRRATCIERVITAAQPHPEVGKPKLWSLGANDPAVALIPWPLPLAKDLPALSLVEAEPPSVVPFRRA